VVDGGLVGFELAGFEVAGLPFAGLAFATPSFPAMAPSGSLGDRRGLALAAWVRVAAVRWLSLPVSLAESSIEGGVSGTGLAAS
jgi:hypothetical protein